MDFDPDDIDFDICQSCGREYAHTPAISETWHKHWHPAPGETMPQRCLRCMTDDTWFEED